MPERGRLTVNRPAQVQRLDDALGRQLEVLADQADDALVGHALLELFRATSQITHESRKFRAAKEKHRDDEENK